MSLPTDTAYGSLAPAATSSQGGLPKTPPEPVVIDRRPTFDDYPTAAPPKPFTAKPLGDYIVVKRIPAPVGLIVEADIAQDKPIECNVVAVSAMVGGVEVGDKVLIRRHCGTEVKVDGEEYTLVLIHDVLLRL